jgi:putative alpha-1,2-mannosidase
MCIHKTGNTRCRGGVREYAVDDFSISRLAQALGDAAHARVFAGRSQNWANLFDTANRYIEPRDASGAFPSGPLLKG